MIASLRVHNSDGLVLMKRAMQEFGKVIQPAELSSVYQIRAEAELVSHIHDLRSYAVFEGLVMAVKGFTHLPPDTLVRSFREIEEKLRNEVLRQSVTILLNFYGSKTQMTPELTLPEPNFHLYAESVLPSAEIAPDFVHPVLKKTLRELAKPFVSTPWGEFVAQGKAMLDF